MKFISILLFAFLISSCAKEDNCIDAVVGNYTGSVQTDFINLQGTMIIAKAPEGGSSLVIQDNLVDPGGISYTGTLSSDCKTITVPAQNIMYTSGSQGSISGQFAINGTSITGSLILVFVSSTNLTYTLTKM